MNKQKVLMLASVASMIDLFNEDNIKILLEQGYEVHVATNFQNGSITSKERVDEYKKELEDRGITTYHIPIPRSITKIGDIIKSYKIVKKLFNENHYKILHCHSPIGGAVARFAARKSRTTGTKVIYTAHGFHFFTGGSKAAWLVFYPVEKFCSRFTDVLITINQEDYKRAQKFHAGRVEYVPGIGIDTNKFTNTNEGREEKRKEFGFTEDDFVFMSTGQISVRKNHEVILRALAKVENPHVKYLIVGFGELEEQNKKLVAELGIENRVVFAGYRGDVNKLLHAVDAFAFPSIQEGLPASLMEAMASGLPVICSRIRGNVDLIQDGVGGYIYDCYDVDGFAQGISKIVNDNNSKKLGLNNIDTMKKFDVTVVNKRMRSIYGS